jgi:hypothetical protein
LHVRLSQNAPTYVKENIAWEIVAHKTINVYEQFDLKPECKTRYVFAGE